MEAKENGGFLFKNERKTAPNHPDYKGKGNFNGESFDISAWVKEGKNGKFYSFSFQEPYQGGGKSVSRSENTGTAMPIPSSTPRGTVKNPSIPAPEKTDLPF